MGRNVGRLDRMFRLALGLVLLGTGLFPLGGIHGDGVGILVAAVSVMPFWMVATASCFVFRWLRIHSLSETEQRRYGKPYRAMSTGTEATEDSVGDVDN